MAVNLINSNDIEVEQTGQDIQLKTSTPISTLEGGISDNTNNIQNIINGEKYSTTETLTNKVWIDGKPIYRKIFEGDGNDTAGYNSAGSISVANLDIDFVINIRGTAKVQTNGYYRSFSSMSVGNANDSVDAYINIKSNILTVRSGSSIRMNKYYVILEYTKTTD